MGYPHMPVAGPLKIYYLTETAFYLHQMLVLNAEAKRKDHWQMMAHHFITVFLMGTSYYYNFTRVGCLIMVLMDFCDIFLPVRIFLLPLLSSLVFIFLRWPKCSVTWKSHKLFVIRCLPGLCFHGLLRATYYSILLSGHHFMTFHGLSRTNGTHRLDTS